MESLETLGDSFLKYAVGQQLFKTFQNNHEGLLSVKKDRIVSNAALCKLGCDHKLSVRVIVIITALVIVIPLKPLLLLFVKMEVSLTIEE